MPDKIQRVARGLNELLSLQGGRTPQMFADDVQSVLELLQFYGLQQLQTRSSTDPAAVEGSGTGITLSTTAWTVLFGVECAVQCTGTITALDLSTQIRRNVQSFISLSSTSFSNFGATVTGFRRSVWRAPFPLICPPNTVVFGSLDILGTDATAALTITTEFGLLG